MLRPLPWTFLRGVFMGTADLVPGVSGGTIALVFGIYERLIASIKAGSSALGQLLRFDLSRAWTRLREVEWPFLLSLLAGIVAAVILLASVIERLLDDYPIEMAAAFLGLVGGSIVVAWRLMREPAWKSVMIVAAVAVTTFLLLGLRAGSTQETVGQVDQPESWAFVVSGAIAICAMILPGISGALILVLLGMYGPVLATVTEPEIGNFLVFALGAVVGLALFSQLLYWALNHHHDAVMAALIGLMAGSMRMLWPWPDGLEGSALAAPGEAAFLAFVLASVGFVTVVAIGGAARRREEQRI